VRIIGIIFSLILFSATAPQARAGTLGCLLGAAAGGFGGSQIGNGRGQLAATALGTLAGCGLGSSIQNSDQQRYQRQYQPAYRPQYGQRDYYIDYSYDRRRVPYTTPVYRAQPVYQPRPQIVWQQPQPQQRVAPSNRYCREYQKPITIGGRQVEGYGQACSYDGGRTWDLGPLQASQ